MNPGFDTPDLRVRLTVWLGFGLDLKSRHATKSRVPSRLALAVLNAG